ncbi:hypothetical protein ACQE5W_27200, partial [Klebsiella pneumoniae]
SAQIREILINESAWEEMTCLFALSLRESMEMLLNGKDNLCHLNTSHAKAYNLQYDITYN